MDKIQKDQKNPTATSESKNWVSGEKAGHCTGPLSTAPPEGQANHLTHPSSLTRAPPLPSPREGNKLAAHLRERARAPVGNNGEPPPGGTHKPRLETRP